MPRPRFTLRVALVVTAIVAVVAWQGGIVYQRKAAPKKVRASRRPVVIPGNVATDLEMRLDPIRKMMGDESIRRIHIRDELPEAELKSLQELFPEATITNIDFGIQQR